MNPYEILGVSNDATDEEIKKAYRRQAMKWHPDRCDNSSEARERFHQAAEAYKALFENRAKGGNGESASGSYWEYRDPDSESGKSDGYSGFKEEYNDTGDEYADTVFWEVMLDYAIKLAQTGMGESRIAIKITQNGCPKKLAAVIAEKAFNIHAHYASNSSNKRKSRANKSTFKEDRLEAELHRAFLGERNYLWSPRDAVEYYMVAFSEFSQSVKFNPLSRINANKRLMRILNFSILLFAVIVVAIQFYPGPSEYKLLPDVTMLQVPFAVLALMFVWTLYRKLWIFTSILGLAYMLTLAFYNSYMPQALNTSLVSLLLVALVCFAPFIFIALFANYFYYLKAQSMIRSADKMFDDQLNKIIWIKNRAGTSSMAAFMFMLVFVSSLVYMASRKAEFPDIFSLDLPGLELARDDPAAEKIKLRLEKADLFFKVAESQFNKASPDYMRAEAAYRTAVDHGSLLAAYKLGYMYYTGEGVIQNDVTAFEYFQQATKAPLAFQKNSLQLTTKFLAESYNNLGIMYQNGFGTTTNLTEAEDMYRKAVEFGSENARRNLKTIGASGSITERKQLVIPKYD